MLTRRLFILLFCLLSVHAPPAWPQTPDDSVLREDGQEPPEAPTAAAANEPVQWKEGECRTSKGPARIKDLVGVCGDLGALRVEKGHPLSLRFQNTRLMGLRTMFAFFTRVSFDGSQLEGAEFRESVITRSSFHNVQCQRCNFSGAVLRSCQMSPADLTRASFRGARVQNGDFQKAVLVDADFRGANLSYSNFDGADLRGAQLNETVILATTWKGARVNSRTRLPFSSEVARQKGIVFLE